jgi:hypothetical protein
MTDAPPDMKVRMSSDLRQKIKDASDANNRTMNAEIVARLEASFAEGWLERAQQSPLIRMEKRLIGVQAQVDGRMDEFEQRIAALEAKVK